MLTDSKIRQAGFIRNSSSKKIIYNSKHQQENASSNDSFSSFQYDQNVRPSLSINENVHKLRPKQKQLQKITKPLTPQIPKPVKKTQPQFQNQKLKNNFFQANSSLEKQTKNIKQLKVSLPRSDTPQFPQQHFKKNILQVQNICNSIGGMKLQGNFSFNPKMQKMKAKNNFQEVENQKYLFSRQISNKNQQLRIKQNQYKIQDRNQSLKNKQHQNLQRQAKQNNYFKDSQKFRYDFQQSSENQNQIQNSPYQKYNKNGIEQEERSMSSSQSSEEQQQYNDQALRYYRQQQNICGREVQQSEFIETRPKMMPNTSQLRMHDHSHQAGFINQNIQKNRQYNGINQSQGHHPNNNYLQKNLSMNQNKKVQNQQSQDQEQLISTYDKKDFSRKNNPISSISKKNLVQNRTFDNRIVPEPEHIYQANGGICFDVDVKQFSQNPSLINNRSSATVTKTTYKHPNQGANKKKVNEKEELLKRRQMAKIYSKQARFRIFGFS